MTVLQLCGPSPTCWLSWQRGGGRCSLVVATQVGGRVDDGALASLSVPCLLVRQRRLAGADDGASALWGIPGGGVGAEDGALASLFVPCSLAQGASVAEWTTVPACWHDRDCAHWLARQQVGGGSDNGACSLAQQQVGSGAVIVLTGWRDAKSAAGRRTTVLACWRDNELAAGR